MKRLAILFGGCSPEYGVSLQSAAGVLSGLGTFLQEWEVVKIGISRQGVWYLYDGPEDLIPANLWEDPAYCRQVMLCPDKSRQIAVVTDSGCIRYLKVDAAFPVLHGKDGEDGCVQGALALCGIPVIGCGVLASAVGMDKHRSHVLASGSGVMVPKGKVFSKEELSSAGGVKALQLAAEEIGYPLFVKPVKAGSSYGISRLTESSALPEAVLAALEYDDEVILEEAVEGFEVGCAIIGGNTGLLTGVVDEIECPSGFFDNKEKYTQEHAKLHTPARLNLEEQGRIRREAIKVYKALGCSGFARVDLFYTPSKDIVFNEVNTIPGLTAHSRFPKMFEAMGMSFPRMLERILEQAE